GAYTDELYDYCSLQLGIAKQGEVCFTLSEISPDYGNEIAAYYWWVFPNLMLNYYPWGLSVNIVKPLAEDLTKVSFITYVCDHTRLDKGAGSGLDRVEREDEAIVEMVQKGMQSSFYSRGRYSPKRERGVHHFHRLLTEFLNNE
nr:SRPBCC family protein [Ignavibacteria bacterium]